MLKGSAFRGLEQRCSDAGAAGTAQHEHLRDIATMRLILRLCPNDLHGTHDAPVAFRCYEHEALAAGGARRDAVPELLCLGAR
jgi:hypothetical protein